MPRIIPEECKASTSGGGGGPTGKAVQTTFVFQPGGSTIDNVYSSWTELMTDLNLVEGPKIVQIDDSVVSPAPIPPGTYDLSDVVVMGNPEIRGVPPVMELTDGAIFSDLEEINHLEISGNSTSPSFTVTSAKQLILRDAIVSVLSGKSEIFSSSSTFDVVLDRTEFVGSNTIVDVTGGTTTFWVENQSTIASGVIDSAVASAVDFNCVDANVSILSQVGVLGSTTITNLTEADKIFYDNAISGLTSDNVKDAIDELVGSAGDVFGPGAAVTDLGIVVWDGTGGTNIKDSGVRHYGASASDPVTPSPADGDTYYNTVLKMEMQYDSLRSKWLSKESATFMFGRNGNVQAGQYYRGINGRIFTNNIGFYGIRNGTVVSVAFTRSNTDSITFEVTADGTQIETLGATTATSGRNITADGDFTFGQILGVRNDSGGSTARNVQGWVRIKWRI